MTDLGELHADLLYAAQQGGEQAGESAVKTGVEHTASAPRALINVEQVSTTFAGPLNATVTATQAPGISSRGPVLPDPGGIAQVMAEEAAKAGAAAVRGRS